MIVFFQILKMCKIKIFFQFLTSSTYFKNLGEIRIEIGANAFNIERNLYQKTAKSIFV